MKKGEIYIFGFRGFPNVQGGIETHVENLAPQLVQMGHHVTACVRSPYVDKQCKEWKGVRLLRLWTVRNAYLETLLHSLICALVAGVRRPEVVHVQGIGPSLVVPLLRMLGLRVVVTHHGEDYNREKWGLAARTLLRLGEVFGMRFAHQRIVISRNIEKLVASKYSKPCEIIPNGDDDPLGYDTSDPGYIRKMVRDALTGRNQEAVDAEVAALTRALGRTPNRPTRRHRLHRWLSHRWWRMRFWIGDKFWKRSGS